MEHNNIRISVVIVNYNVEYFLEQCLNSVYDALKNVEGEVFVVDNNSIDSSVDMVREKFPQAQLIANKDNVGFSKANNQAMRIAKGDYIVLLNPDTVVEEDTFQKCVDFMDQHPDGGGLGVRMIDGKGQFLPESKRGLPTPSVAFYKIFGFSSLFPKNKTFGQYHLGYLDEHETNEVEILSGAFMLMRKEALDKVGLLDEAFFMYGEDIDLSYRIIKGGYKNYYFPKTQIIHYKGESTKKSSINYVFVFYRAMVIFAEKHFSQKNAKTFSFFINMAIYFRAGLALLNRFIKRIFLPVFDLTVIICGLFALTKLWSLESINFPVHVLKYALPGYALTWFIANVYSSSYDSPIKLKSFVSGTLLGTGVILIAYALLPKDLQFSRLFILLGALFVLLYYIISRVLLHFALGKKFDLRGVRNKNFAIVGEPDEVERVKQILKNTAHKVSDIHSVSPSEEKSENDSGVINQLDQIIDIYEIDEVIFCAKNTSAESIINWMSITAINKVEFKIAQPNSMYLIGSNSIDTAGDLYLMEIDKISTTSNKRNKRTFDFVVALLFFLFLPITIWFFKFKGRFIQNCWSVLIGRKSWVGYSNDDATKRKNLPQIRKGVLTPAEEKDSLIHSSMRSKLNLIYARDYSILTDILILRKHWRSLDR
ncbi:glycosyltransferase family 2 protein [Brumimicrobium aurantiacum]|uniref:Glycosyltransferase n=1 Tax=Brumimicrobium aurantiacum TaxID=1737063 RepID=A0A3E1EWS6_9FLAO|nr:glycosyltransferase [Brumimicrobium aurantiacum]RFC54014.1 glycosyltransferase [Brumimicrobium aurantiacum]